MQHFNSTEAVNFMTGSGYTEPEAREALSLLREETGRAAYLGDNRPFLRIGRTSVEYDHNEGFYELEAGS